MAEEQNPVRKAPPEEELDQKIQAYQQELDRLKQKRNFPYVYIVVAFPVTIIFLLLTIISEGLIDFTTGISGSLFFSLLITCSYLVLFQPNKEEVEKELQKKIKNLYREKAKLEAGIKGERDVAYALSWLPKEFITFNNILLPSQDYETQQFDHLVIGPTGIFHIETKSINGVVLINENQEWCLIRPIQNRMIKEGMENPMGQLQRHEAVLKEFMKLNFPEFAVSIQGIIALSNPQTLIEGECRDFPVLKKERLVDYIKNYPAEKTIPKSLVKKIALSIACVSCE
ncbi:nuclease-related domain-containing protein [Zhaonella formicivorans]|uniref:nuclease-related domain-containing protein n=1 Tax=Zhaonella formicivorans TaxID=2528593 RepID=UPI0010D5B900|nr:nuclease-related domain-containing protein [Zhaonella formicivorans]